MANSKNRCTGCGKYFPPGSMIKVPAGNFHDHECLREYGMKQTDKLIKSAKVSKKKANAKQKKCKVCTELFIPWRSAQPACSVDCALKIVKQKKKLAYKAETREMKKALNDNSKPHQLKLTQATFNQLIRIRDKGKHCISCGRHHTGQNHAGHYLSVGAHPELRFNEWNVHLQCAPCNNHLSGNIIEYRKGLLKRIGPDKLDWLEGQHEAKHYTLDDIKSIRAEYKLKIKNYEGMQWD